MQPTANRAKCLYCGGDVQNVSKGEHIIPKALGGTRTISQYCKGRKVCNSCNNGVLSELDKELSSRSPMSFVAAHELNAFPGETWDVDLRDNLLLEAKPDYSTSSMKVFPQIIFESGRFQVRGDFDQMQRYGTRRFGSVFLQHLREAFHAYKSGNTKRFHLTRINSTETLINTYRFPPRIFSRLPIEEFKSGMSFELKYLYAKDKQLALSQMDGMSSSISFHHFESHLGSKQPPFRCHFLPITVLRSLIKMGINLLAAFCPNTSVNRDAFASAVGAVLGETEVPHTRLSNNGFVYASDIEAIRAEDSAHSFRLLHMDGNWYVYSSFFGGRIGTAVCFPGPNSEHWRCANVIAPLKPKDPTQTKEWTITTSSLLQPLSVRIEWENLTKIIPTIPISGVTAELREISSRQR